MQTLSSILFAMSPIVAAVGASFFSLRAVKKAWLNSHPYAAGIFFYLLDFIGILIGIIFVAGYIGVSIDSAEADAWSESLTIILIPVCFVVGMVRTYSVIKKLKNTSSLS